ncbi:unnamed protein product, partial [Callosobruchus maculatus]
NDSRLWKCWSAVRWFECWKKSLIYGPLTAVPVLLPHQLWLSYVAAGLLAALAIFHLVLTFKTTSSGRRKRRRKDRLLHHDTDSFESSKFEEVTEVLDDGLPDPIPGSSHSICDSLAPMTSLQPEPDGLLEI